MIELLLLVLILLALLSLGPKGKRYGGGYQPRGPMPTGKIRPPAGGGGVHIRR